MLVGCHCYNVELLFLILIINFALLIIEFEVMKSFVGKIILFLSAVICLAGCKGTGKSPLLPNVSGKAGEVIIVMDRENWEGTLGASVRSVLGDDTPYLATQEPLFTLVNVSPEGFADLFKVHRNILIFNIDPQCAQEGVIYKSDVWSAPQCVIQLSAYEKESALGIFEENGQKIASAIEVAERDRIIRNSVLYEEKTIAKQVNEIMGGSPHFPSGYKLLKKSDDFIWIADQKQYTIQGVLIYRYPVSGPETLGKKSILEHRNEILMNNVPGMFENTYMTTSTFIEPTVEYLRFRGRDFAQMRGFWEVENDFMGGPFVSHSFYSQDGQYVIVLDAFVYAPKYDKRQYLRTVESILYSFEWVKNSQE